MKKNQKIVILAIIVATALLAWWLVTPVGQSNRQDDHDHQADKHNQRHEDEPDTVSLTEAQIKSAGILIDQVKPARILTTLTLPGEIRFNEDRTAHIVPRVDGIVESVAVDLGQQVKKGQVLATLASTGISELRSDAMAAQKRLTLARTVYEREKELWEDKISAEQDYLQALQTLQEAEITVQNTTQKLRAIGAGDGGGNLNRYELRAPFDGMIVERHLSLGESVQANANVMTLADLSSVWAEIVVSAKDLNTVKVGTSVTVQAASFESQAEGVVAYVGSLLGEQTRTATARVTLSNPDRAWRPGLFVNVAIVAGEAEVPLAVSAEAVQTLEGRKVVFVRHADGFKAVLVETGRADGKVVEVVSGLEADADYVTQGSFVLKSELGKVAAEHDH
ncbi:efflux RND transporter periplasmic adaptor subunit [Methylobacillus arboreus]|uniref:efflux RND transporter periplasmic adaptor subunit n=1 Tax=Methylobacillus arboreus TaxID=755170 RepID=UPI0022871A3A|nr:efflux RND transporter periplasmic adaptor subunit [Methylobacillus arboreus]